MEEKIKIPEKAGSYSKPENPFRPEKEPLMEKRENNIGEQEISAELRKEIEMMELDDSLKAEAKKKAEKIEFLGEKEKLEHLLQLAREKGLVYAINVAKKMNDSYLLDILHDILAKEGFYQQLSKKKDDDDGN